MKKVMWLVIILLIVPIVSALTVTLNSPANANITSGNSVTFNCTVKDITYDISSVKLYTDTSGSWTQTGSTVNGNVSSASFTVTSIPDGTFSWNCLALNENSDSTFSTSNRSFTVSTSGLTGTIPNQSWAEDTVNSEAFDLDDYFTGATIYTVTGNSSIKINISNENKVTFIPSGNFTGVESVVFGSDKGDSSNVVKLNVTNINDAPYLITNIPDQSIEIDEDLSLSMTSFFGEVDPDSNLTYSITANDFSAVQLGSNMVISSSFESPNSESIFITASDGELSIKSNEFVISVGDQTEIAIESEVFEIESYSPESDPNIYLGENVDFSITFNGEFEVIWYVNGEIQEETGKEFNFDPVEIGTYTVKAEIDQEDIKSSHSWILKVSDQNEKESKSILSESTQTSSCGNGIVESGENCGTCPLDIVCEDGAVCQNSQCVVQSKGTKAIAIFFILFLIIIVIAILIYYFTTLRKSGNQAPPQRGIGNSGFPQRYPRQAPPSQVTDFYQNRPR